MIKVLFWDIDGTLLNTEHLHYQYLAKAFKEKGLTADPVYLAGKSESDIWKGLELQNFFPSFEEWVFSNSQHYAQHISPLVVRPGIVEALSCFAEQGFRQVAVSNGNRAIVDINLQQTNLLPFFDFTISCDDVNHPKPNPEPYQRAIEQCKVSPQEGLAIEDTPVGIQSAKVAGLFTVAFPNPYNVKELDLSQADILIDHPQKLIEIVSTLANNLPF